MSLNHFLDSNLCKLEMNMRKMPPPSLSASAHARLHIASLLGIVVVLSGCNGSDGSVRSAALPVGSAPQVNQQLPLVDSETFNEAASAKFIATVNTASGVVQDVTLPSRASFATLSITYNATDKSYTVADEASAKTFAPADLAAGTPNFDHYTQSSTAAGGGPGSTTVSDL